MMQIDTRLMEQVKDVLQQFGTKYITKDGSLKRNAVISDLDKYDKDLMVALLANNLIKDEYTEQIADTTVFKLNHFIEMFEYQEFWGNSFTKYANRIGLTSDDKFISDSDDVVLDFPYKDTVLKAGMTKEDVDKEVGADEPFLNETLAHSEISELFEPKVLVNAKRYDSDGEHESTKFHDDDNLVIKGNNLIALHSIAKKYAHNIKMIYIDVPYYFRKKIAEDTFKYNSNFQLSTWLIFLKNRLEIAKKLLAKNGSIWISINDEGMHYLKILADSVFSAKHFVGTIPRKTRNGKSDVPFNLSQDFDWLLVYTNGSEKDSVVGRSVKRKYYTTDDFPGRPWRTADLTSQRTIQERPNSNYTMINPRTGKKYPVNPKRSWAVAKETFDDWYSKGGIGFPDDYDFMSGSKPFRRVFKDEDDQKKQSSVPSDFLMNIAEELANGKATNRLGNDEITSLFSRDSFGYAKPEELLQRVINVSTTENDIVLDFFMGSATTQAVAMKMHRHFIGIEQMDYINTVSIPRLQKVIAGEQGGISKDVAWQGGGSFVYVELMEKNQGFLHDLQKATNTDELNAIYTRMKQGADLDFRADLDKYENDPERTSLSFEDQKKLLIKLLDKNQLYYNEANIDDANVRDLISDSDYQFNKSFYNGKESE